jgi:hypothetical protein
MQIIYVMEAETPAGVCFSTVLGDLGFTIRKPAPSDHLMVIAALRADGSIVTATAGEPIAPSSKAAGYFRALCKQKYRVQVAGNTAALTEIEGAEREYLAKQLAAVHGHVPKAVQWAPRLRRLLCLVLEGIDASRRPVLEELIRRDAHLIFLLNQHQRSATFRSWPGVDRGLELFPDFTAAGAATCGNDPDKRVTFGDLAPREVFASLARQGAGAAIHVPREDGAPRWVLLYPHEMLPLAEGRLPP